MSTLRLARAFSLASLLPVIWSLDSELQGAIEAEVNADTECVAGDCSGVLSLLQIRQEATTNGADDEGADGIAGHRGLGGSHAEDVAFSGATKASEGMTVGGSYWATQKCYGFTGGTCNFEDCKSERNAVCHNRRCICESACAGPDEKCYSGRKNEVVATGFTLRNMKWPTYSMYFQGVSVTGQLKTTDSYSLLNLGKDKFSLFKMPGNRSRFILGSAAYPDKVARIATSAGTAISLRGLYSTDLSQGKSPGQLALAVCYNHKRAALMFGSNDGEYWAYIHAGSWLVYALHDPKPSEAAVGLGALWKPSPALKKSQIAMLPAC